MPRLNECPVKLAASRFPHAHALVDENQTITFDQLDRLINSTIQNLKQFGVTQGDRIAVLGSNSIQYAVMFFSAIRLGAVLMPLNLRLTAGHWQEQIDLAKCSMLVYDDKFTKYKSLAKSSLCIKDISNPANPDTISGDLSELENDREALIIFSSGSLGKPRGVRLSWENIYYSALGAVEALEISENNCWLAVLPFYHVGGISILMRTVLSGGTTYIMPSFDSKKVLSLAENKSFNFISIVPTMLKQLLESDHENLLRNLKAIVLGGAASDKTMLEEIVKNKLPVLTTYGMTETASMVTILQKTKSSNHIDSSGKTLPYREIKISDEGHILIRGKTLFIGYLGQPRLPNNYWFDTNDKGHFDADNYLHIDGRADNQIISGGESINPDEIENALNSLEHVSKAAVIAIKDDKWGKRPAAFVESDSPDISESDIRRDLTERLPRIMIPDWIIIINSMPLTGAGKIDRQKLIQIFNESKDKEN